MSNSNELKEILDRITTNKHTEDDIAALRNTLKFNGDQVVLQLGKDNINFRDISQARDIIISGHTYQNADAEEIKKIILEIIDEYRNNPVTIKNSNIFVESFFNYIEYEIGDIQKKIVQLLFLFFIGNLIAIPVFKSLNFNKLYTSNGSLLLLTIVATIILVLFLPLVLRSITNQGNFWNKLTARDKKRINNYLNIIKNKIFDKIELNFNPEEHHVALSGKLESAYPHQAYEEKAPGLRRHIRNLDTYLMSPINKHIFIYGPPGCGKTTTLYKIFLTYQAKIKSQKTDYIPIFIHANQIANILDENINYPSKLYIFIERIFHSETSQEVKDFVEILRHKQQIKLVIIVDALDEFVDKTKRRQLFDCLSSLIKNTSSEETKWILSCREEEYKAYSDKLNVANVRIQPMNLQQINKLLEKRNKSFNFDNQQKITIRRTIFGLTKAERQNETFLKNPYYLTLWLYQLAYSRQSNDCNIPSINELHSLEIKREIAKATNENPSDYESVANKLISNTISVLSILSYYLLTISLEKEVHQGLSIKNSEILQFLTKVILPIELNNQDEVTKRRIEEYSNILIKDQKLILKTPEDNDFLTLINILNTEISLPHYQKREKITFLIVISSIIAQSYKNRLIDFDIKQGLLFGFFNQRAADYLAACHLTNIGLTSTLKNDKINFWLFRAIAIAIAISEKPQDILQFKDIPTDPVFETAIGNGLTLITSQRKEEIKSFLNDFINHLMNENRLFGKAYDPCDPLRVLREVRRLCLNGYSKYINLSSEVFYKLLKHKDTGISEMATETLLSYACQVNFRYDLWQVILRHLVQKSLRFEFGFLNSLIKFVFAIKEVRK